MQLGSSADRGRAGQLWGGSHLRNHLDPPLVRPSLADKGKAGGVGFVTLPVQQWEAGRG